MADHVIASFETGPLGPKRDHEIYALISKDDKFLIVAAPFAYRANLLQVSSAQSVRVIHSNQPANDFVSLYYSIGDIGRTVDIQVPGVLNFERYH